MKNKSDYWHIVIQTIAWFILTNLILKGISESFSPVWAERLYILAALSAFLIFYVQQTKKLDLPLSVGQTEVAFYLGDLLIIALIPIMLGQDWPGLISAFILMIAAGQARASVKLIKRIDEWVDKTFKESPRFLQTPFPPPTCW